MAPGIQKKDVESVLSIAKRLRDQDRRGLEIAVSQNLPAELPQDADIPDSAMYDLGKVLNIDQRYVEQALKLHSGSVEETLEFLKSINVNISRDLRSKLVDKLLLMHSKRVREALTPLANGFTIFGTSPYSHGYHLGYDRKEHRAEWKRSWLSAAERFFGKVEFKDEYPDLTIDTELTAFTERALPLISGIVKDITSTIPHVRSCTVIYDLRNDGEYVSTINARRIAGDPF